MPSKRAQKILIALSFLFLFSGMASLAMSGISSGNDHLFIQDLSWDDTSLSRLALNGTTNLGFSAVGGTLVVLPMEYNFENNRAPNIYS